MPKGSRKHLKRLAAPLHWPIRRKERPFTIRTNAGPHPMDESLPLGVVIRDLLKLTKTLNETRRVIAKGLVLVDGRVHKDYKYPVGLMDIIEVPEIKTRVRMLPSASHLIQIQPIAVKEAKIKPCKIVGKTTVAKGNIQLHLHDGRNILLSVDNPKGKPKESYHCGDTLLIKVPEQHIESHIPLKEGTLTVITGGVHVAFVGKLVKMDAETQLGTIESTDGTTILTAIRYVFPIGEDKPIITLPEAS
ncbi:MAG: 30S ribosomal protein S4e [Promethearchaeota archaeon]